MMKIKIGAIVQARMSSERFPGKVMYDENGKPMLWYLLERLKNSKSLDTYLVATSKEQTDTAIAEFCHRQDIPCYRGPLDDVAGRFREASDAYKLDAFVRINGDSPLLDYRLIDKAVKIYLDGEYDLVTNVMPATYPKGQSVEVLRSETYKRAYSRFTEDDEREHVTPYFYKHPEDFHIHNFAYTESINHIRLCVDTPEDMDMFKAIVSRMDRPFRDYSLEDILRIYHTIND
jgi:spore coat polysaccharide biosynthesis protein SpsF